MSSEYPEHEKLAARQIEFDAIQSFVEHLELEGCGIFRYDDMPDVYKWESQPLPNGDAMIYGCLGIDSKALEAERKKMLSAHREGLGAKIYPGVLLAAPL